MKNAVIQKKLNKETVQLSEEKQTLIIFRVNNDSY